MATKQPQLNGAFYGPAIPPPDQPRRHHRGRSCCCCLFSVIWKVLLTIIILVVLAFIIFALIVQPRSFKFYVSEAKLTQFNYTSNTLNYNLALNFTAHNPNKKLSIYYDRVEGHAFYEGFRFSLIDVINWKNSFRQYTRSTDRMSGVFSGQQVMVLDQGQVSKFDQDKRNGAFDIYVKLHFSIRFRLGDVIGRNSKAKAKCELKVPLSGSYEKIMGPAFELTECGVKF